MTPEPVFLASWGLGRENILRLQLDSVLPRPGLGTFSMVSHVSGTV